ncbi:HNH endonuclease [bacterium]|jgi:hypothetical protein|nr:HNH endonuclease [bacterium]
MNEIFKYIEGYEGIYQVSNHGRIKSLARAVKGHGSTWEKPEMFLKTWISKKGYEVVILTKDSKKKSIPVHRLVATAFIPSTKGKPQVNHIDCCKTNNHASNLEWCDNSENQLHAFKNGLNYHTVNHRNANIKRGLLRRRLSDTQVSEIKSMRVRGLTYREIAETFSISGKMAEGIIKGQKYRQLNLQ